MTKTDPYYPSPIKTLKSLGLLAILLLFLLPATYAQNTKGDRPEVKSGGKRESRFRLPKKKKNKGREPYNRVQSRGSTSSNSARSKPEKAGKNIYPQRKTRSTSTDNQRKWSGGNKSRVSVRSATGQTRNVYPQRGPYVNNSSKKPRAEQRSVSNRSQLARIKRISHQPDPPKRKRVTPNSASRSYISRRSINAFAGFWNKKPKGEKAYIGDISGRKLRTKNFETKRPKIIKPTTTPYYGRKRVGDKAYKGPTGGGYVSATKPGKAWKGDITGRKIRGRNFSSKRTVEGQPIFPPKRSRSRSGERVYKGSIPGGGNKSVSGKIRTSKGPLPAKTPGIGANGIDGYSGNIKGRKTFSDQGGNYTGNIKTRRPLKGGGSVSGKSWNNRGRAIAGKSPASGAERAGNYQGDLRLFQVRPGYGKQGVDFSGNIKARKPLKGGGSVSGKMWNNKGQSVSVRPPSSTAARAGTFQGNIKASKPMKGGGSVSGKMWNNKQSPIQVRIPPAGAEKAGTYQGNLRLFELKPGYGKQGVDFSGNIKTRRPAKGGGSISGKLWNNKEQPIPVATPTGKAGKEIGGVPGKHHQFDFQPSMRDQGEEFTGYTRLPRFKKHYIKNPNSAEEALKKVRPDKSVYQVDGLQVKVKQQDYKKRPHAAEGAMAGIAPGKNSIKASEYSKGIRLKWDYKHNPSSADDALDTREPGKAFARATDYQGNIKMQKFNIFGKKELHPDAQFVKTNKNNTDEERDVLTNFKLWWARLFKKSDTQPDHLKDKIRKPRYDKGEQGMWYD